MLLLTFNTNGQSQGTTAEKSLNSATSSTIVGGWEEGRILPSLMRVGLANHLPVSIVIEGNSLCTSSVAGSSEGIRVEALIDQVQKQDPAYSAELRNHVLYVHPKVMTASTRNALDLRIPIFNPGPTSADQIGIGLWMFIRGLLVPQQASVYAGPLQNNTEALPAFTLLNSSVHDILDRVITLGQGGAWIMYQVSDDWQSNPKTMPYEILSYSGQQRPAESIRCPEDK